MKAPIAVLVAVLAFSSLVEDTQAASQVSTTILTSRAMKEADKQIIEEEVDEGDDDDEEEDDEDEVDEDDDKKVEDEGDDEDKDEDEDEDEEDTEDTIESLACDTVRKKHISSLLHHAKKYKDKCLDKGAATDSTFWDVLLDPLEYLSSDKMCRVECLKTIWKEEGNDGSLIEDMQSILQVCGGPTSTAGDEFMDKVVYGNLTWADVASNYDDLSDEVAQCAPANLDQKTRATCADLVQDLSEYFETDRGTACAAFRDDMLSQGTAIKFCESNGRSSSCYKDLTDFVKKFTKAGCVGMELVAQLRADLAGACDTIGSQYCYPVFQSFADGDLFEAINDKVENNDVDGANALVEEACDSKCFRKVAKEHDVWSEGIWGFDLLCKQSDASCYTRFLMALKTEDDDERADLLCSDRCFAKIARSVISRKDTPEDVAEMLEATMKYLCIKPTSEDETVDSGEEEAGSDQKCLSKVTDAEAEIGDACSAVSQEGICTPECAAALPGWIKKDKHTCCIGAALEYRSAVWSEEAALESALFWGNLTEACGIDVETTCPVASPKFKRRRGIRLCGIAAELLNSTDVLEALKEDILAAYGITDENLANLVVSAVSDACSSGSGNQRRSLQDGQGNEDDQGAEVTFDIQGQSDEDVDGIVGGVGEVSLENTNRALPDEMSGVEASEFDAGSSGTPSSAFTTRAAPFLAILASAILLAGEH